MSRKLSIVLPIKCRPMHRSSNNHTNTYGNNKKQVYKNRKIKNNTAYMFMAPSLLGVLLFSGVPFIDVCKRAFLDALGKQFVGFKNFSGVVHNEAFELAMKNTFMFMLICIPSIILISLGIAIGLNYFLLEDHRMTWVDRMINGSKMGYLLPFVLPVSSIVILWRLIFDRSGLLNSCLYSEEQSIDWMHSGYAFVILCLCYLWKNIGFYIVLWLTALQDLGKTIMEAGTMDGASYIQLVRYIILPQLKETMKMLVILAMLACFKSYREAYLVGGDYPDRGMYLLQHVFNNWFAQLDVQKMSAGAVLLVMILSFTLGIFTLLFKTVK